MLGHRAPKRPHRRHFRLDAVRTVIHSGDRDQLSRHTVRRQPFCVRDALVVEDVEVADTDLLFRHFEDAERHCRLILERKLPLPAYDQCLKASHLFNLLDARGVISVTERAAYIGRVRALAKACCTQWLKSRGHSGVETA